MTSKSEHPQKEPVYFNRELSWLAFNRRVLNQAQNEAYPLLERLRFLSFVSSNLDEFYEIRVAGLLQQVDSGVLDPSIDGLTPKEQLEKISINAQELVHDQYECWQNEIVPSLAKEQIVFTSHKNLSEKELAWLDTYFEKEIYPVLTPLAIDFAHPFPQLTNKALYILVWLEETATQTFRMAVIPVPRILPRVIGIHASEEPPCTYIFLSDILRDYAHQLFPGLQLKGAWEFRITRNSDLYINEEETENLLNKIEEELYNMRRGAAVRLEIRKDVDPLPLEQLLNAIHLPKEYIFFIDGPLNLLRLFSVYNTIDRPDLKFEPFKPHIPKELENMDNIFEVITHEDILLHHPYDSFTPIIDFIEKASKDPQVFAIKQTLYRTSGDSLIINALKKASRNGKQVTALIELKARFDEANNIERARSMEEDGVHVVYGMPGLKTHAKCCLIVRREPDGLKQYAHLGTGNYNATTARTYTDFSLFTSNTELTNEVAALFNTLTGFNRSPQFKKLLVAPFNLHNTIQELIFKEIKHAQKGQPAKIIIKMNSLADEITINNLYLASKAGVKIDLIIRGICCLVPGIPGLSENITVRSILGRFLEHSRFYYFENHPYTPTLYIGSADWMPRNFFRRIETVCPIENPILKERFIQDIIQSFLNDRLHTKFLDTSGKYTKIDHASTKSPFSAQTFFLKKTKPHTP